MSKNTKLVRSAGKPRVEFFAITVSQLEHYWSQGTRDVTLAVWMMILNAARASREDTVRLTDKWRAGIEINRYTLSDALGRLEERGLIRVCRSRGRNAEIEILRTE